MEKKADFAGYDRDSQWYPMTDDEKRRASGVRGMIPASMALASGFLVFRLAFPGLVTKGPAPMKAMAKHPWLLPMLIGAGIGASVGFDIKGKPMAVSPQGTGQGVDAKNSPAYHQSKTAGTDLLTSMSPASLAYIHSGVQQRKWQQGTAKIASSRFAPMNKTALDTTIFGAVTRLAKKKKRTSNGYSK